MLMTCTYWIKIHHNNFDNFTIHITCDTIMTKLLVRTFAIIGHWKIIFLRLYHISKSRELHCQVTSLESGMGKYWWKTNSNIMQGYFTHDLYDNNILCNIMCYNPIRLAASTSQGRCYISKLAPTFFVICEIKVTISERLKPCGPKGLWNGSYSSRAQHRSVKGRSQRATPSKLFKDYDTVPVLGLRYPWILENGSLTAKLKHTCKS